jgi:hypothetical protein
LINAECFCKFENKIAINSWLLASTWCPQHEKFTLACIKQPISPKEKVSKYNFFFKCCAHLFHNLNILVLTIKGHGKLVHLIKITYSNIYDIIHQSIAWFLYIQLQIIWNIFGYEHVHVIFKTSIVFKISYEMLRKWANHSFSNIHSLRTKFQLIHEIFLSHVHFHNDDVFPKYNLVVLHFEYANFWKVMLEFHQFLRNSYVNSLLKT